MKISSREQFENWLLDNGGFEDARVLSLSPVPKPGSLNLPSEVNIELAYQIEGNYKAHSTRISRVFRIHAINIAEYRLAEGVISQEHWSEGIEMLDSESPVAFQIDVPAMLTMRCSQISVKELPNLTEIVAPWLSERDVFAKVPAALMPTPSEWQARFNDLEQNVVWHIYCGNPAKAAEVPSSNYEGWFLQTREDLDENHQGIFFFFCRPDGDGFRLQILNQGASDSLWHAAMKTLAAFDRVEIHCGNCEFSGREFLREWNNRKKSQQAAKDNALPRSPQLRPWPER